MVTNIDVEPRKHFFIRYPLISFYMLSYTFFWGYLLAAYLVITAVVGKLSDVPAIAYALIVVGGSWTPTLAAICVQGIIGGSKGIRELLLKYTRFKVGMRWYPASLIPLALALAGGFIYLAFGGKAPGGVQLTIEFWIILFLGTLLQGAGGEEIGWHGFALPRLMERFSPVKSALILALFWDLWHIPLWFLEGKSGMDLLIYIIGFNVGIYSLAILMSWVYIHTKHSLIPMILMHYFFNFGMMLVSENGLGLMPETPLLLINSGFHLVLAIIILIFGLSIRKDDCKELKTKTFSLLEKIPNG